MYPIISVITPSFNQGKFFSQTKYIRATIESVLTQRGDFYLDYIVKDGGSTDELLEIVRGFAAEITESSRDTITHRGVDFSVLDPSSRFSGCRGISYRWVSEKDKGQYDGINKGLSMMIGDYFGYLNSDDVYEPGALAFITSAFAGDPSADVVYGNAYYIDSQGVITGLYPTKDAKDTDLRNNCYLSQPSVFVRSECYKELGGFNAVFNNSGDYEYWLRLWSNGKTFKYIRPVLSSTRIYPETKTISNRKKIHIETLAILKHYKAKIDWNELTEFLGGYFLFGRFTSLVIKFMKWSRDWKLTLLAKWYMFRLRGEIEEKEKQAFKDSL